MRSALVLLALPLAGCLSLPAPGHVEVCLAHGAQAQWSEPGAAEALLAAARRAEVAVETAEPGDGFPTPFPGAYAVLVQWRPEPAPRTWTVRLWDSSNEGRVVFQVLDADGTERDERLFRAFLAEVGLSAQADALAASLERSLSTDRPGSPPFHEVEAQVRPDLSRAFEALAGAPWSANALGQARIESGAWSADVNLPVHTLETDAGGGVLTLQFDGNDVVRAHTTTSRPEEAWPALQARVREAFARFGLPPPTFEGADGGGASCRAR